MKFKTNRYGWKDYIPSFVLSLFLLIFLIFLNLINNNPISGFGFYFSLVTILFIFPIIISVIEYNVTLKEIILEEGGVGEYKKGKCKKFFTYEEVQYIEIKSRSIIIFKKISEDFPYKNIVASLPKTLFKFLTSKDFRKRWSEFRITFRRYKKGFAQHELPFVTELSMKADCNILYNKFE